MTNKLFCNLLQHPLPISWRAVLLISFCIAVVAFLRGPECSRC